MRRRSVWPALLDLDGFLERRLLEIRNQDVETHVPKPAERDDEVIDLPLAVGGSCGRSLERLNPHGLVGDRQNYLPGLEGIGLPIHDFDRSRHRARASGIEEE